jgi:precorrin-2/cobalt-factor-2 C20-methyltransferase
MNAEATSGRLYGVGLGPGDPDLVTIKSLKALRAAPVVAYFAKRGRRGNARTIADSLLVVGVTELPLIYPVTVEIPFSDPAYKEQLSAFYEAAAVQIIDHLKAGRDVALLCEGDPLFYGSFMHLYVRLKEDFPVTICPGVTGMSGCWTAAGTPMTWGDDVLTVLPGTLARDDLARRVADADALVFMKLGRNFAKVRSVLTDAGLLERAIYVERGSMANEKVMPLFEKHDDEAPYFSIIIVPGQGRRP